MGRHALGTTKLIMPDLKQFFLNGRARDIEYETLSIFDPSFSKIYRIVRNSRLGLTATLETSETVFFEYYPLRIVRPGDKDDLDQTYQITLGDLGDLLASEIRRKRAAGTMHIKPVCTYRTFGSDDLSSPLRGPEILEIPQITGLTPEGSEFEARPPRIDNTRTGEIYSLARFPMLRGVL